VRRAAPVTGRLLVDERDVATVEVARTAGTRRRGLLGRTGLEGGFWLEPCHQVHTIRMRFAIDVAYLDRRGRVMLVRTLPPGRIGPWRFRARTVLETEAGALETWGVGPGARVRWEAA
jgi:uncharacterized membrane protein (UPF0127 family)